MTPRQFFFSGWMFGFGTGWLLGIALMVHVS